MARKSKDYGVTIVWQPAPGGKRKPAKKNSQEPHHSCEYEKLDAHGFCEECGALLKPQAWHFYELYSAVLEWQRKAGKIDDEEYQSRKKKLDEFKKLSIEFGVWKMEPVKPHSKNKTSKQKDASK
jgi:hypothetical protein